MTKPLLCYIGAALCFSTAFLWLHQGGFFLISIIVLLFGLDMVKEGVGRPC